jgi:hypothetical protein
MKHLNIELLASRSLMCLFYGSFVAEVENCDVQLLFHHIWKLISSFVKENKVYICCILILGLFAIVLSFKGLFAKLPL